MSDNFKERYLQDWSHKCWQREVRENTLTEDLRDLPFDHTNLKTGDFDFQLEENAPEIRDFIKRYEWLGKMPVWVTQVYTARYQGVLGGVVVMATPNSFEKILPDYYKREKLISRGACAAWTPKNLASALIMFSIRHMVKTTEFRLFTAYSDPSAGELGTIYQACNFYYMGQRYGSKTGYFLKGKGLVSSKYFRERSAYVRAAKRLGIEWDHQNWMRRGGKSKYRKVDWSAIPDDIEVKIRAEAQKAQDAAEMVKLPPKHKYIYLLGENKKETKTLRKAFEEKYGVLDYPQERGK